MISSFFVYLFSSFFFLLSVILDSVSTKRYENRVAIFKFVLCKQPGSFDPALSGWKYMLKFAHRIKWSARPCRLKGPTGSTNRTCMFLVKTSGGKHCDGVHCVQESDRCGKNSRCDFSPVDAIMPNYIWTLRVFFERFVVFSCYLM